MGRAAAPAPAPRLPPDLSLPLSSTHSPPAISNTTTHKTDTADQKKPAKSGPKTVKNPTKLVLNLNLFFFKYIFFLKIYIFMINYVFSLILIYLRLGDFGVRR